MVKEHPDCPAPEHPPQKLWEGRTPQDFAIEFAEYMARSAEQYLGILETEEVNSDDIADFRRGLRSSIYEFRKRAAKCIKADAMQAYGEGYVTEITVEGEGGHGIPTIRATMRAMRNDMGISVDSVSITSHKIGDYNALSDALSGRRKIKFSFELSK